MKLLCNCRFSKGDADRIGNREEFGETIEEFTINT